jgi:hypothetical protein
MNENKSDNIFSKLSFERYISELVKRYGDDGAKFICECYKLDKEINNGIMYLKHDNKYISYNELKSYVDMNFNIFKKIRYVLLCDEIIGFASTGGNSYSWINLNKLHYMVNKDAYDGDAITTDNNTRVDRNSSLYHNWLKLVLERDDYTCQCCGSKLNPEVHHILNYAKYKDLRVDINNGIVLCECCHSPMIKGSFHNTYGTRNNTKEQLQEYINAKRIELELMPIIL